MKPGIVVLVLCALVSCPSSPQVEQPSPKEMTILDSLGSHATKQLVTNLQQALLNAIMEGGPANGITVCSDTAQALTASISGNLGRDIAIKRTSAKIRNPENRPDEFEKTALEYFSETLVNTDSLPPYYAQKIHVGGKTFYRYYKPMQVGGLCLNCHGAKTDISPKVQNLLKEKYPSDEATGYREGDFRGVISVTIDREI